MAKRLNVLHLVDDTTPGGVMRVVDFLTTSPEIAKDATHKRQKVARGKIRFDRHDADIVVSHLSLSWRNLPMLMAKRRLTAGRKLFHVEHTYTEQFVALNVRRRRRFESMLKVSFALFDKIIAVSEGQANWIQRRGYCAADKLQVVQSCVDLSPFKSLKGRSSGTTVIGAIGRLEPQKGFDILIEAFRQIEGPKLELHIFGQGSEELALRNLAAGDSRIKFRGYSTDPLYPYAEVDLVAMPSRWEAYGLVAIEALASGRPLVAASVDGLVDHEPLGAHLYPFQSQSALCAALQSTIKGLNKKRCKDDRFNVSRQLQERFVESWQGLIRF